MAKKNKSFRTLLVLNALAFAGMYVFNRTINTKSQAKNILRKNEGRNYPWKYGDIYYEVKGSGSESLLLVHDANAYSSSYEWSRIIDYLSDRYTVYTVDLIGCGRSDKPALTYTNYLYVQLITSFIRDVIGSPAKVAATGLSASFVTMTALQSPELISEIVMINPWNLSKLARIPDKKSKAAGILFSIPILGTTLYNLLNARSNLEYLLDEKNFYNPFKVRKQLIDACYESSHKDDSRGRYLMASTDGRYINWNINRAVTLLKQPVTIIYGDQLSGARQSARQYQALNSSIKLCPMQLSKMFPHLEEPEHVAKLL